MFHYIVQELLHGPVDHQLKIAVEAQRLAIALEIDLQLFVAADLFTKIPDSMEQTFFCEHHRHEVMGGFPDLCTGFVQQRKTFTECRMARQLL